MNKEDLSKKVLDVNTDILQFENVYDMEDMNKNRMEYNKLVKKKLLRSIPPQDLKVLRDSNTLFCQHSRMKKTYESLKHKYDLIIDGCQNCKRKDPDGDNIGRTPYILRYRWHSGNTLIKRKKWRFVDFDQYSDDLIGLCLECSEYLSNHDDKVGKSFENIWPSFVWYLLTDKKIIEVYGTFTWRFVPLKWRFWWIHCIYMVNGMRSVDINNPPSIFKDITVEIEEMRKGCEEGKNFCHNEML